MEAQGTKPAASSYQESLIHLYIGVTAVILIAIATTIWTLMHLRQEAEDRVAVTTQNLALSLYQTIESIIDTIDVAEQAAAYEIGKQISSRKPDANEITSFLVQQTEHLNHVAFLRATNEKGDVIYGKVILSPPSNSSDRDYFIGARDKANGSLFVGKPLLGRIDKKWAWPVSRRINYSDGSFGGVVFASVLIDDLEKMFAQMTMQPNSVIVLRDSDYALVARHAFGSGRAVPIGDKTSSNPLKEALKKNPQEGTYASDNSNVDGIARFYSYRRSEKYGFTVLVGIPLDTVMNEWRLQASLAVVVLAVFVMASLAYLRQQRQVWMGHEQDKFNLARLNEELVQRELQTRQLAFYDPLTNLPNRRLLSDRISQTMAASKRSGNYCAILFLDLDNFKPLNDEHGHEVGDLLLVEAADRIKSCIREIDTVARLGGDEFLVVISDISADKDQSTTQANIVAKKILTLLAQPYLLKIKRNEEERTVEHMCTVSIGIALFLNHEISERDLIASADKAMYQAKLSGRNTIRVWD